MAELVQHHFTAKPMSWLQNISAPRVDSPRTIRAMVVLANFGKLYSYYFLLTLLLLLLPRGGRCQYLGKSYLELPGAGLDSGPEVAGTEVFVVRVAAEQNGVGSCLLWGGTCAGGPRLWPCCTRCSLPLPPRQSPLFGGS